MSQNFIILIVSIFGSAIVIIALCKRLGVPPVIGFILTGLAAGPLTSRWLSPETDVGNISELGVVFLLFLVGLDFNPERIRRVGKTMLVGGSIQVALTIIVMLLIGAIFPGSMTLWIMAAFIMIQSSTAIALKSYQDRGEISSPHAEISIGISLFQDIATVVLLIFLPLLAAGSSGAESAPFLVAGRNVLYLASATAAAYLLFPLILHMVIGTGIRELVVLLSLVLCLGFAMLARSLGFSLALGSFLCGVLLSRSSYHPQIIAEVVPFRDVFLSLFFISIGMMNDWAHAMQNFGTIALLAMGAMVLKTAILFLSAKALRFPFRTSLLTGIGLSNIGEFGFVIMVSALPLGLLTDFQYQTIGGAAILSMLATPLLIAAASRMTIHIQPPIPARKTWETPRKVKVVIVGFGLAGRHLAAVLRQSNIPYVVIEANGGIVQEASTRGEQLLFGDASRQDILEHAGIKHSQAIVFLISDLNALLQGIRLARALNKDIFILSRVRRMVDIDRIIKAGADEVVSEEFETSIELFTRVLTHLHIPRNVIRSQTQLLRDSGYKMLRVPNPVSGISDRLVQMLAAGTTDVFEVMEGHAAIGRSLKELSLRNVTGTSVILIVRNNQSITNPQPDLSIQPGDALVLMGSHAQIDSAFDYLERGAGREKPADRTDSRKTKTRDGS